MIEQDAAITGWQAVARSRFEVAAPRHFLLPAILLLLVEEAQHGYSLAKGVHQLQMGRVDRPSVYRALAQLEHDGLVDSGGDERRAVQGRRSYRITEHGEQVLRQWMGVIKQERDGLDRVLRRYVGTGTVDAVLAEVEGGWHAVTATPWSSVSSTSPADRSHVPLGAAVDRLDPDEAGHDGFGYVVAGQDGAGHDGAAGRYRLVPQRSVVLIEARSSVGPITFGAAGVTGEVEAVIIDGCVDPAAAPSARLEIDVSRLRSGNSLYDAELMRRVDARRYPTMLLDLRSCASLGGSGRYRLGGDVHFHGVTTALDGTVAVETRADTIVVRGEQLIDIRDFGIASPTALMLRIYPDVIVKLHVEAICDRPGGFDDN